MVNYLLRFCLSLLYLLPVSGFAQAYEARMLISEAQQQWFTDLMQANIAIDPNVYRGMPLALMAGPTFENGVSVFFMIFKSDSHDVYNILAAPTFKQGKAYGSGIDMDDYQDFWLFNDLIFQVKEDTYKVIVHTYR